MASNNNGFYRLPVEVILITIDYLEDPHDLLFLMRAVPYLVPFLNSRHLRAQDENGDTILHLIVNYGIEDMIKPSMLPGTKPLPRPYDQPRPWISEYMCNPCPPLFFGILSFFPLLY